MTRRIVLAAILLLANGCARTDLTSYTDPSYRTARFSSVMVLELGMSLTEEAAVEMAAVKKLADAGVSARRGLDAVPPTRRTSDLQMTDQVIQSGADAVLLVVPGDKGHSSTYVPPVYYPGQTYGTINTFGNTSYLHLHQTPGTTVGGYSIAKPKATYAAMLVEVATGNVVWQATAVSAGNAFATYDDLAKSMAEEAAGALLDEGLLARTTYASPGIPPVTQVTPAPAQTYSAPSSSSQPPPPAQASEADGGADPRCVWSPQEYRYDCW